MHEDWGEDEWLREMITTHPSVPCDKREYLLDHAWWNTLDHVFENPMLPGDIEKEFWRMRGWLREHPNKKPKTSGGWKRFVRNWLTKRDQWTTREKQNEKYTQAQRGARA